VDETVGRVWMGALMGGVTTAAGFIALIWTSFPGVREMAVASAVGMLAAVAITRYVLPPLLRGRPRAPRCWNGARSRASARSTGCAATGAPPRRSWA
jgi:predicted exporter